MEKMVHIDSKPGAFRAAQRSSQKKSRYGNHLDPRNYAILDYESTQNLRLDDYLDRNQNHGLSNKGRQLLQLNIHVSRSPSRNSRDASEASGSIQPVKPKLNLNSNPLLNSIKVEQPEKRPKDLSNIPLNLSGINIRPNQQEAPQEA